MADTPSPSLAAIDEAIAASRSEARRVLLRGLRVVVATEVGGLQDSAEVEALLALPHAATAEVAGTDDPTCASCGSPVDTSADLDADAATFTPGEDVCVSCAYARMGRLAREVRSLAARMRELEAAHDAAIAAIVEGLRADAAQAAHDYEHSTTTEETIENNHERNVLTRAADSIATLHAAALARHTARAIHGQDCDAHMLHESAAEVVAERDELRATLANERGEGEPPSEGWEWADDAWHKGAAYVWRRDSVPTWEWTVGRSWRGEAPTARAAMIAADATLTPGGSDAR